MAQGLLGVEAGLKRALPKEVRRHRGNVFGRAKEAMRAARAHFDCRRCMALAVAALGLSPLIECQ